MALSKSVRVFMFIVIATMTLASCAKKDSDFKGRKNSAGAGFVGDPGKNLRADTTSNALGIIPMDIMGIQTPVLNQQGALTIVSRVGVGQTAYDITMVHFANNMRVQLSQVIGDITLIAEGACINYTCSPYYLNIRTMRGNQNIKQVVIKKFFAYEGANTQTDYVLARDGAEFEPLENAMRILDEAVAEPTPQE